MAHTDTEFLAFYNSKLLPLLKKLEPGHKRMRNNFLKIVIPVSILSFLILYVLDIPYFLKFVLFLFSVYGFGIVVFALQFKKELSSFQEIFKTEIIAPIIAFVNSSLSYHFGEFISQTEFDQSKIFYSGNEFKGDDLVTGKANGIEFKFCDVDYFDRDNFRNTSSNRDRDRSMSIFKGIFLHAFLPDKVIGETIVLSTEKKSRRRRPAINKYYYEQAQLKMIYVPNAEFTKQFEVYSNDQAGSSALLTPWFIDQLLSIQKKIDRNIFLSFKDNNAYAAVSIYSHGLKLKGATSFFEPTFFKSLLNIKLYAAHAAVVNNLISLTQLCTKP